MGDMRCKKKKHAMDEYFRKICRHGTATFHNRSEEQPGPPTCHNRSEEHGTLTFHKRDESKKTVANCDGEDAIAEEPEGGSREDANVAHLARLDKAREGNKNMFWCAFCRPLGITGQSHWENSCLEIPGGEQAPRNRAGA